MRGDALASGARSAQFSVAPGLRFDEGQMRDDLRKLSPDEFTQKYYVTHREYDLMLHGSDERVSSFAEEMKQRADIFNQELERDAKQQASLNRECFLTPFVPIGISGRVIVTQDVPAQKPSKLLLPRSQRKSKDYLPTTGHVIKETIELDPSGYYRWSTLMNKRVLFSPMSGTAICFKGFPTWRQLELTEIMAIVNKEDAEILEEELEPLT
jgi:hypothetical protein